MNAGNADSGDSGPHQSLIRYRPVPGYRPLPDALPRRVRKDADGIWWGEVPVIPAAPRDSHPRAATVVLADHGHTEAQAEPMIPKPRTRAVPDLPGHDRKPDPMKAETPAEFVEVMRRYRRWAGSPSFRQMAKRGGLYSAAAFCEALRSDKLPKYTLVNAFVVACDGSETDWQRWATAWRRLDEDDDGRPPVLVPVPPPR